MDEPQSPLQPESETQAELIRLKPEAVAKLGRDLASVFHDGAPPTGVRQFRKNNKPKRRVRYPTGKKTSTPIARSKRGPMGQVTLYQSGEVSYNACYKSLKEFENEAGGIPGILAGLTALPDSEVSPDVRKLLDSISDPFKKKWNLAKHVAHAQVEASRILTAYARGRMLLGQSHAALVIADSLAPAVRTLVKQTVPSKEPCRGCNGSGQVLKAFTPSSCPACGGSGSIEALSEHYEFATEKLFDLGHMLPKSGGISINQQVGVKVEPGGQSIMAALVKASSNAVHFDREAVEAEVVGEKG